MADQNFVKKTCINEYNELIREAISGINSTVNKFGKTFLYHGGKLYFAAKYQ